jgi:hypothetical protein
MKQVKNDLFQMTHPDPNPDESEDRGKNPWKQAHAVSETKPGAQIPGWLELINENRKSDLLEPN